jgi:predicted nucleic acid-binding protein
MGPTPFRVVVDANALIPLMVADTLMTAAAEGFFQIYWSAQILAEVERNLPKLGVSPANAAKRCAAMKAFFPEAMVVGYEPLIAVMENDPKDRHVAAAATKAGAELIVTNNLRDFARLPDGMRAESADDFLCALFNHAPERFLEVLRSQAVALRRPPVAFDRWLAGAAKSVPGFAAEVAAFAGVALTATPARSVNDTVTTTRTALPGHLQLVGDDEP